jgi:hypothetical protein
MNGIHIIQLKCESDQMSYDQSVREVAVEREDEGNWYGKPTANPECQTLQWPKFAWKEVEQDKGLEDLRCARLAAPTEAKLR